MLPGPVFKLELRRLSRRKRYYALLTLYGLALLYIVWSNNPQDMFVVPAGPAGAISIDQWHYAGKSLFDSYAIWQMVMVLLLTPAMVAGVIAEERERKTMTSLLASTLTSGEIVLGKLCARMLHLACFVALGLPILVLVQHFGGVGLEGVLITFVGTATTAFFLGAASILVSTFARRPRDAVVSAYLLEVVWHIGTAGVLVFFSSGLLRMIVGWIALTCPLFLMIGPVRGTHFWESPNLRDFVSMMVLQVALGAVMTTVAVRRLRRLFLNDESKQPNADAGEPDPATPVSHESEHPNDSAAHAQPGPIA